MSTEENITPLPAVMPAPQALEARRPFDYRPTTLEGALKLSDLLASSNLVPSAYRGKPADVFVAMQWGHELDLAPLQALQSIAVINGKPGLYGDAGKALLLAGGCQIEEADPDEVRETGVARCTVTRRGRPPVLRTFSIEDAQTAKLWGKEGPWKNYPLRMLAWRAFWLAARDAAADMLKGLSAIEELADIEPMQPAAPPPPRVEPPKAKANGKQPAPQPEPDLIGPEPAEDVVMASASMIEHVRKVLARGELSGVDVNKKMPEIPESLEGITVGQVNRILQFAKDPTA